MANKEYKNYIELIKTTATGAEQEWKAWVEGNVVTYEWGQKGGKKQTEVVRYAEGKNEGRANATTPEQQCLFEAARKARKKVEKSYAIVKGADIIGAQKSATVTDHDGDVPMCMLAETLNKHPKILDGLKVVDCQTKLDGNRCLINLDTCELYSRSRKRIGSIPGLGDDVAARCKELVRLGVKWVDGELFSKSLTFNQIQQIIRSKTPIPEAAEIQYHMYDVVLKKPWLERRHLLWMAVNWGGRLVEVETKTVSATMDAIEQANRDYVAQGYEGVIVRLHNGVYENKRSRSLLKHKTFQDSEYKVIGFQSEKNRPDLLGAVVLETEDGQEFNARPAMSDVEKAEIWKHRCEYVGLMATIKYQERDTKSGIPRFGILRGFRAESDIDKR